MLKFKRSLAAAAMIFAACNAVNADVFEKTPADALMAIKVANLDATNTKIAKLAADLGVAQFDPRMNDPLSALLEQAGFSKGIDRKGDVAIVFMPPADGAEIGSDESMLVLLPVTSTKEFLTNFAGAAEVDGATQITTPSGQTKLVADWGKYAAMSSNTALLKAPAATLKLTGVSLSEAGKQDFLLYANTQKLSPKLMEEIDKGLAEALKEIDAGGDGDDKKLDPKYRPLAKAGVTQVFGIFKSIVRDGNGMTLGANLTPAGLNFAAVGDFKPDTYLGKLASSIKGSTTPLTTGLPATKYLVFGGASTESPVIAKTINDAIAPIIVELNKIEGLDQAKQLTASYQTALTATKGGIFAIPAPKVIGTDAVAQQIQIVRGGGKAWKTASDQTADFMKTFMADLPAQEGGAKPTLTLTPKAKTIDGVVFDQAVLDAGLPKDDPATAEATMMMEVLYGQGGLSYVYAPLGDDFIIGTSATDETLSTFMKAYAAKDTSVAALPHVKAVSDQLPKARVYEGYVALDEVINTSVGVMQQRGMGVPLTLPPDLAPLGFSFGAEGPALRIDTHLPQSTLKDLVAAGMQLFMQMQGGGGGGGGGM